MNINDFLKEYLDSIIQNPKLAIPLIIIGFLAGFAASQFIASNEIKEKDERIKLRDEKIALLESTNSQLRTQLGIDPQKPTRFQLLNNKDLRSTALNMANKINDLGDRFRQVIGSNNIGATQLERAKTIAKAESILGEYSREYSADATALFVELKSRGARTSLEPAGVKEYSEYTIANPVNGFGISDAATALRQMAESIPK